MTLNIQKIKKTTLNPRRMSKDAKSGLKNSIEKFGDISGIVFNKKTNELVGGNHRWELLQKKYGNTLNLRQLGESDLYAIYANDEFTSYTLREVNWDEQTAKAANITANSQAISGFFTKELDDILKDLKDEDYFNGLLLGNLFIDIPVPNSVINDDDFFDDVVTDDVSNDDFADIVEQQTNTDIAQKYRKIKVDIDISGHHNTTEIHAKILEALEDYKINSISVNGLF
jgi:hypothetical protein